MKRFKLSRRQMLLIINSLESKYRALGKELIRRTDSPSEQASIVQKMREVSDLHYEVVSWRFQWELQEGLRHDVPSVRRLDETHQFRPEISNN